MKKLLAMLLLAGGVLTGNQLMAQKVKSSMVPAAVTTELMKKYPQAKSVTWEKEKGNFEANWGGKSGEDMSVMFTPTGALVEQVAAIEPSALPAAVHDYVKAHYAGAKIKEAGKITDAAGKTGYEAEVKGKVLVFDGKGAFVKTEED